MRLQKQLSRALRLKGKGNYEKFNLLSCGQQTLTILGVSYFAADLDFSDLFDGVFSPDSNTGYCPCVMLELREEYSLSECPRYFIESFGKTSGWSV